MLLQNANIVFPTHEVNNAAVLIENERIAQIFLNSEAANISAEQTINLDGKKLFAGFIDIHNHGAVGVDINDANASELQNVSRFLARNGVTSWLPTLVPDSNENYQKCIAAIDELMNVQDKQESLGARVIGVHYEGPFVNEKMCGALRVQYFKTLKCGDEFAQLPRLQNSKAVYLSTVAPEIEGGIELIKKLREQNWVVAIGHTRADVKTLNAAYQAGAQHLTHFFNAMTGLHHRDVGVVGWGMANKDVTVDIIADSIHVAPSVLKIAYTIKTAEKMLLISDSVLPTGLGDGDFSVWNEKISVVNGRTQNERGSIAGSVITMLDAVKTMLELGVPTSEVSRMASLNPARLLRIENDCGSIETGKRADLTAIDSRGNTVLTIIGGQIAHQAL